MAAVCSVDGKMTRGNDPAITSWTSAEDLHHFRGMVGSHGAIVMGRKTYEAARRSFHHNPDKRRIVLTHEPERFADVAAAGELEFTAESPARLTQRLQNERVASLLVVGGGEVNAAFLAAGLIDELYLTIEPLLFGSGTSLAGTHLLETQLELISLTRLNPRGSLLLHYRIKR
ncbi:MAG TPA: dihydrofolate reductase family protein [Candidatus Polarisedimenticolaceae bacterium]|nr:dihydrofolate reductase family protein [Candidatus Polarisedimenticolaceae bacterium]